MTGLPRISPVPVEAWTGPEDDPTPAWRRVLSFVVPFVGVLVLCFYLPGTVPWVLGAAGVVTLVKVVREVRRARELRARTS